MNWYEEKQAARKERLAERAERVRAKAEEKFKKADMSEAATGIPFGQPILVGHHSERRHRNTIERAHNAMRKGVELSNYADELERRANTTNNAISSDDPEAVEKLKTKLEKLEAKQEHMKAGNKLVRKKDRAALVEQFGEKAADELLTPDFAGRLGFPSYALTNNNANMKRIRDRIKRLEVSQERTPAPIVQANGFEIVEDVDDNRIKLVFPGKPAPEVRKVLKSRAFKWSPSRKAWVRMLNNAGRYAAECVARELAADPNNS